MIGGSGGASDRIRGVNQCVSASSGRSAPRPSSVTVGHRLHRCGIRRAARAGDAARDVAAAGADLIKPAQASAAACVRERRGDSGRSLRRAHGLQRVVAEFDRRPAIGGRDLADQGNRVGTAPGAKPRKSLVNSVPQPKPSAPGRENGRAAARSRRCPGHRRR